MPNTHPKHVSNWLKTRINDRDTIFDKSVELFDIIQMELENESLYLRAEDKILMIKLCKFFYENSFN